MTAERDSMILNEVSLPALGVEERSDEACARHGRKSGGASPPSNPYWRESNVNSNCGTARFRGMEAASEPQHRTEVNSRAGRSVWVSVRSNATPSSQSRQDGSGSGGGGKTCDLTLGGLHGSGLAGRTAGDGGPTPMEKSDRLIVATKPGNAGGAKGATG